MCHDQQLHLRGRHQAVSPAVHMGHPAGATISLQSSKREPGLLSNLPEREQARERVRALHSGLINGHTAYTVTGSQLSTRAAGSREP